MLVNWHEGNNASMNAVATELQDRRELTFVAVQACYTAQRIYEPEGGELTHGGGIETLAVLAHDPRSCTPTGSPNRPAPTTPSRWTRCGVRTRCTASSPT